MDDDRTRADADADADAGRPRRRGAVRWLAVLLALSVAALASVVAWQVISTGPAHARSSSRSGTSAKKGARTGRSGRAETKSTAIPTTTSAPPATAAPTTTTTTAGPLRVVEIGDSLGVDLGDAMESTWPSTSVQLTMAARGDTGLANTGYFDWPTALAGLLTSAHPQLVIVFLGANDLQSIVTGSTVLSDGTPAWNAAYAARVTAIISESVRAGARVLWIGEPAMQDAFDNAGMTRLDGIAQGVVAHHPGEAAYLSSNSVLAPGGTFTFDVNGPTGQAVQVRTPDGVHLMPAGADLLAAAAAKALATTWGMHVTGQ